jgi:hypothetical protein
MKIDPVVEHVMGKYHHRSRVGIDKYGTTLYENNTDDFLNHLQEELMDATLYIQKLMDLKEELTILVKDYPNDSDLGRKIRNLVS